MSNESNIITFLCKNMCLKSFESNVCNYSATDGTLSNNLLKKALLNLDFDENVINEQFLRGLKQS